MIVVFDLNPLVTLVSGSKDAPMASATLESGKSIDIVISAGRLVGLGVLGSGFRPWLGFFLGPLLNGFDHLSSPSSRLLNGRDHRWCNSRSRSQTVQLRAQGGWTHHSASSPRGNLAEFGDWNVGSSCKTVATFSAQPDSHAPSFDSSELAAGAFVSCSEN